MSLLARVYLANVLAIAFAVLLLAFTPITITAPVIRAAEAALVISGAALVLGLDLLLVRRTLAPLRRLTATLAAAHTVNAPPRLQAGPGDTSEVVALADAFNALLDRLHQQHRDSSRGALRAQESERLRIARELHDEIGQTLTAVALHAERSASGPDSLMPQALRELADNVRSSLDDVRRIAAELRPETLDDLGLANALISLTSQLSLRSGTPIEREIEFDLPELSAEEELAIYRIAQEALTNAIRHASATSIRLSLRRSGSDIELRVVDDGHGIPATGVSAGSGLSGMRERTLLIGGLLQVRPAVPRGTDVVLRLPNP